MFHFCAVRCLSVSLRFTSACAVRCESEADRSDQYIGWSAALQCAAQLMSPHAGSGGLRVDGLTGAKGERDRGGMRQSRGFKVFGKSTRTDPLSYT